MRFVLFAFIFVFACTLKKREPEVDTASSTKRNAHDAAPIDRGPEEAWEIARRQLIEDEHNHFRGDRYYAITDPALIDPILVRILDYKYSGKMPDDVDAIRRVTRRGRGSYAALNHSEAGRAFLNVRIEERYENPPSSTNGKIRTVEYDTAPGVLEEKRRNNWAVLHSRVTQGQSWKTEEVAAAFQRLGEKYSETVISARIRIPLGTNHRFWEYRWIRHQERIAVKRGDMPSRVWVADVPKGDWGPFIRGERSLQPEDMELQTLNDMVWGVHPDAPL